MCVCMYVYMYDMCVQLLATVGWMLSFHQIYTSTSEEEIRDRVSGPAIGFVGLAVGAGLANFFGVSNRQQRDQV